MYYPPWFPPNWLDSYLLVVAATEPVDPSGEDWGNILATYGLAAPFLLFLLYVIRELRRDIKDKDGRIDTLTDALTEKVIPLVTESNAVLKDSTDIIRESQATTKSVIESYERLNTNISRLEALSRQWEGS